jgi:hypothetical protein
MTAIDSLELSGTWSALTPEEVQRKWGHSPVVSTRDSLIFERTASSERCGCYQVAHFHADGLRSISLTRQEPDEASAIRRVRDLEALLRPPDEQEKEPNGPVEVCRWMLEDENSMHRVLGLQTEVTSRDKGWQFHAVISLFRTTAASQ